MQENVGLFNVLSNVRADSSNQSIAYSEFLFQAPKNKIKLLGNYLQSVTFKSLYVSHR